MHITPAAECSSNCSALGAGERSVDLERLREVLGTLNAKVVVADTAKNVAQASAGVDSLNCSRFGASGRFDSAHGVLDILDDRVDLEHVGKMLGTLRSKVIARNTGNSCNLASAGTDSKT